MVFFLIISLTLLVFFVTYALAGLSAAPWLPTRSKDIQRFIDLAEIKPGQTVYDLGCGDARLILAASKLGAYGIGYEISLLPYLIGVINKIKSRQKNCRILYKSFWQANLHSADLVYVFLIPQINLKIKKKLGQELKPGAKVIAYVWPLPGLTPIKIDKKEGYADIYLYEL